MYKEYFGFTKEPFSLTPDPEYFYSSTSHDEALTVLEYGIKKNKGFMVLVGEVGTGKTLLTRVLIKKIPNLIPVLIINPFLSSDEILTYICRELNLQLPENIDKGEIYYRLQNFLIEEHKKGKTCLIIIDEAQNLPLETFEMIRQLSNIELEDKKLLQILFVGQPELLVVLNKKELRQLKQRISIIVTLKAMDYEDTKNYINFRVNEALRYKKYLFTESAIKRIYKATKGIPRDINKIADLSLLIACSEKSDKVTVRHVNKAIREYFKEEKRINKKHVVIAILLYLFLFAEIGYFYFNRPKVNLSPINVKIIHKTKKIVVKKIDNRTRLKVTKVIKNAKKTNEDNKTITKKFFYVLYQGPFNSKRRLSLMRKILKNKKVDFYEVKKGKKIIIQLGVFSSKNNALEYKKMLERKYGLKDIKIMLK